MERYVDPNSGAAPQPGGYAGPQGAEKGFAMPTDEPLEKEQEPSRYEAPGSDGGGEKTVDEIAAATEANRPKQEKSDEEKQLVEALSNPKKVLADLDEGDSASTEKPEPGEEEEANNNASIEHQAVDLNQADEDDGQSAPAGVAEGDSATGVEDSGDTEAQAEEKPKRTRKQR